MSRISTWCMASKGLSKRQTVGIRTTYEYIMDLLKEPPKNKNYSLQIPQVVDFPYGKIKNHLQQIQDMYIHIYLCMAGWISKMKLDFQQWYENQHHESILKYPWAIHEIHHDIRYTYHMQETKVKTWHGSSEKPISQGWTHANHRREVWGHSKWRSCDDAIFGLHPLLLFLIFLIIICIYTYVYNCIYLNI